MSIEHFIVKKFSIFQDLQVQFIKGVNVIIDENGKDKTQLLKLLYSSHSDEQIIRQDIFHNKSFLKNADNIQNTVITYEKIKYPCVFSVV